MSSRSHHHPAGSPGACRLAGRVSQSIKSSPSPSAAVFGHCGRDRSFRDARMTYQRNRNWLKTLVASKDSTRS